MGGGQGGGLSLRSLDGGTDFSAESSVICRSSPHSVSRNSACRA